MILSKSNQLSLFDIDEFQATPTTNELDNVGVAMNDSRWLFKEASLIHNWGNLPWNKKQKAFVIRYVHLIEDAEYKQWLLNWIDFKIN